MQTSFFLQGHGSEIHIAAPLYLEHDGAASDALVTDNGRQGFNGVYRLQIGLQYDIARTDIGFGSRFLRVNLNHYQANVFADFHLAAFLVL
jgi:hypothetical protein